MIACRIADAPAEQLATVAHCLSQHIEHEQALLASIALLLPPEYHRAWVRLYDEAEFAHRWLARLRAGDGSAAA